MFVKASICYILYVLIPVLLFSQVPIGAWREHLSYKQVVNVVEGMNRIYAATPNSLFSLDLSDESIERMSKINGLSETGVSAIAMDRDNNWLVIGYDNSNVDVLIGNEVRNIDALKRKDIAADKRIYAISCIGGLAYLCTGLGLVLVDPVKQEIRDTYIIGNAGGYAKLTGLATDGGFFYGATSEGLKKAPRNGINLADYRNWELVDRASGLPPGLCEQVVGVSNIVVARQGDSLFALQSGRWQMVYKSAWKIVDCQVSSGKLVVCEKKSENESRVLIINTDGAVENAIGQSPVTSPNNAIIAGSDVWIADRSSGLLQWSSNSIKKIQPNSPDSVSTGEMVFAANSLWVASGLAGPGWVNHFIRNGIYQYRANEWISHNREKLPAADTVYDIVALAVDPVSGDVWAGSFGAGLLQMSISSAAKVYRQHSFVAPDVADQESYRVTGLLFDGGNNLWISNFGAEKNLVVRKPNGEAQSFAVPFAHSRRAVSQIVIDQINQKWIISPGGNGLFCFNHGNSLENTADDRWRFFRQGAGNGNLPDNNVLCLAVDKNGFVWVGTSKGIGLISCTERVFDVQGCEAVLPVVQQDNFAGYLFRDEEVQAIAVDGADRKWVGTKKGVWLISPDGEKTIHHFREDNSPLLSNDVRKIAIDPASGEVFFSTVKGICSFRGSATEAGPEGGSLFVFPNPVPPQYTGQIAIRGLPNNAIVKITGLDGRLVYQTRANGGQATWDGHDYKGRKVSTGVYLILVSDDKRRENAAGKIVVVR